MSARIRLGALLGAVLFASGCTVGPSFRPPAPPAPKTPGFVAGAPSGTAIASKDEPPDAWWRLYSDPALDQLVRDALTHNKNILQAEANLRQARGALDLARSERLPTTQLTAGAQYGVTTNQVLASELLQKGSPDAIGYFTAGLDASYEVDLFGRIHRAVQAARADAEAQRAAENAVRVSVAGETVRAYLNACAYAEAYKVAQQAVEIERNTVEITQKERTFGAAADFDVARARQTLQQVVASGPVYEGLRRTSLYELAVLTGRPPEDVSEAADKCESPPRLQVLFPVGDVKGLIRRRPDVREAERALAANVARIGVAVADLYPDITIGATGSSFATQLGGLVKPSNTTYAVGPLLSWSFPNILAAKAEVREARAAASASYANFDAVVLQALQDVETALAAYGAELDRNRALVAARDQAQIAFRLGGIQYQNGAASFLDVLTAQSNLVDALQNLAASDENLVSDQATLFKALGGGWAQAPAVEPPKIVDGKTGRATEAR